MISRFRRPVFCLVLLAIAFTVIPAQEEDWARGLTSIQSRKQALIELLAERERLEEAGDNVALVKVITRIGELHLKLYDLDSALAAANDARQLAGQFRGSQNETLLIDTLTFSAYVHIRRDENRPAFPLLTEALDLSRKLKYRRGEAESLAQTGSAYFGLSKLPEAEQSNDAALAIWRELQDKRGEAKTLVIQGETYMLLEKAEEATQALKRAESIWRELKDPISLSNTLMDLIFLSMRQGQWQSALSGLNEAEKLLTDKEAEPYLAGQIAMSYGLVYETYAQWERALGKYQESLVHYRDGAHNKTGAIDAGNKVGRVQAKLGHVTEAIAQIEQGLTIAKEIDRPSLVGLCHEDLGQVWLAAGLYEQARSEFQLAVFYFAKAGDKRPWARAQSFLGDIEFLLGNQASARRAYQSALDVFQRPPDDAKEQGLPDYTNEAALSFGLGKLALQQGQLDEAEKHLNRSIELTERLRENASSKDLRSSFLASVHDRYEAYVELLMARHYQQPDKQLEIKAFEASESGRARGLIDSLQNYQREFRRPSDPALLIAEEKLQREEQKLVDARAKLISRGGSEKEREKIDKELTEVLSQYETLQARINSSANFASLFRPKPDYESIKRALTGADTSLLEYSLGNSNSFAWLVTQDGLKSYKLADKQTITNAANKLLQLLRAPAITSEEQAQLQTAINEVTRLVVEPLADQLKTSRLIVVPDGILQYVPFQVLKASAHATEPLVAQFDIIDAPSAFALAIVKKERVNRQAASKLLVGFGDAVFSPDYSPNPNKVNRPDATVSRSEQVRQGKTLRRLFNAKRELRAIGALVGNEAIFYEEYAATRDNLLNTNLSQFRILHVVTHGILDDDQPELSGLFLSLVDADDQPLDGFVGLADIYAMRAPVELVVLSACDTALGRNLRGEGLMGLTRGFMYAGASSVVASLWKVDDAATAELMKHFYTYLLRDGMTPPAALRAAQNQIRAQRKWSSPFYWAGFTFHGDFDLNLKTPPPVVESNYRKLIVVVGLSVLLAGVAGWFVMRRRRIPT